MNRTEQNRIYFNKRVQGPTFEIKSKHAYHYKSTQSQTL